MLTESSTSSSQDKDSALPSSVNHFGKMSLWIELPQQFGMLLHSALLSALAELAVLRVSLAKNARGILYDGGGRKPLPVQPGLKKQMKPISATRCFLFSWEFQRKKQAMLPPLDLTKWPHPASGSNEIISLLGDSTIITLFFFFFNYMTPDCQVSGKLQTELGFHKRRHR